LALSFHFMEHAKNAPFQVDEEKAEGVRALIDEYLEPHARKVIAKIARRLAYCSAHAANNEKGAQISPHSPSDSSSTKLSASPRLGPGVGSPAGPEERHGSCRRPPPRHNAKELSHCMAVFLAIRSSNDGETAFPPCRPFSWA
jgi:hypothetical protein